MNATMDMTNDESIPKRGDLLYTNTGDRRERTWIILQVHPLKPTKGVLRCRFWAERWWEVEPELRMRLFRSAERNGGQKAIIFHRYPSKKRRPQIHF